MGETEYSSLITGLPEANIPMAGVRGWISQGKDHQIVFFDIQPIGEVPAHTHGDQWGVVLSGAMELTIGGQTRKYGPGDSYHIPAGTPHGAKFLARTRVIDVFADVDRWKAK